jgi:DNA-binding NarL/FixJ family response regulator
MAKASEMKRSHAKTLRAARRSAEVRPKPVKKLVDTLRPREMQCALLAAHGLLNKEIAFALGISAHVVRDYFHAIYQRTGIRTRCELVARYVREVEK